MPSLREYGLKFNCFNRIPCTRGNHYQTLYSIKCLFQFFFKLDTGCDCQASFYILLYIKYLQCGFIMVNQLCFSPVMISICCDGVHRTLPLPPLIYILPAAAWRSPSVCWGSQSPLLLFVLKPQIRLCFHCLCPPRFVNGWVEAGFISPFAASI